MKNNEKITTGHTGEGMSFSTKAHILNENIKERREASIKKDTTPRRSNNNLWLEN